MALDSKNDDCEQELDRVKRSRREIVARIDEILNEAARRRRAGENTSALTSEMVKLASEFVELTYEAVEILETCSGSGLPS